MALIPWWINYPNVNDEILNLDWLLTVANENTEKISNFINLNTIKYANPILWDITSQYEANTIVVNPQTGDAYISTQAVPYGVALSNDSYWTRIYNYADAIKIFHEQIAAADEQLSTTATAPRAIGDLVWLDGLLYRVTANMIAGDSYVVDSNCVKTTIEEELKREMAARSEADTAVGERITSEAEARAEADTALGERITSEAEARAEADTALSKRIDSIDRNVFTTYIYIDAVNGVDASGNGSEANPYKSLDFAIDDLYNSKSDYLEFALKEGNYYLTKRVLVNSRLIIAAAPNVNYSDVNLYLNSYLTTEDFHYYGWLLLSNLILHGKAHMHGLCDMINVYGDSTIELDGGSAYLQNTTFSLLRIHNEHCRILGGLNLTGIDEEPITVINSFVQFLDAFTFNSNGNVNKNMMLCFASNITFQNVSINISTSGIYAGSLYIQDSQVFLTPELYAQLGAIGINATRTDWVTTNRNPE